MAAKKDLSWDELNNALTANGITNAVSVVDGKVMIDVGAVTGDSTPALTNEGVVEFLYKVRESAGVAARLANETLDAGDQLNSFPAFSYGAPSEDGQIEVVQISTFNIPLNLNSIKGVNP